MKTYTELTEGFKNIQHRKRDDHFWKTMTDGGAKATPGDPEYSHQHDGKRIAFHAPTNKWKVKAGDHEETGAGVASLHKHLFGKK